MQQRIAAMMCVLCVWATSAPADAAEGRVFGSATAAPDPERVAKYVGAANRGEKAAALKSSSAGLDHADKGTPPTREKRAAVIAYSHRTADFHIYDAGSSLITDQDDDGYYSEFRIRFDADAMFGDALVYAKLYLRRVGERDWLLYHTTDDFWIYGESPSDDYYVTTTLDDGFPTSDYDVVIDLYEAGYSDIVATLGPAESAGLSLLPLEEAGLDVPIGVAGYRIRDVSTTLLIDDDDDGHYSQFRIEFDPDADFDGSYVYAVVWVRPQGGEWIEEHSSGDFLVHGSGTADVYSLTADWISGYPTAFYDVQIDLHDAASGLLAASAGSERPELSRVPLEDQSRDVRPNPPTGGDGGGGALMIWWLLALAPLLLRRRGGA